MNHLLALALAAFGAQPEPAAAPDPKLTALVRQLGHADFKVREAAARTLANEGQQAVPALMAGAKDADTEVAEKCRQLLPAALVAERTKKLARLVNDPAAPPAKGLAGVERFLKVTGDEKATRQLYAEMLAAHHAVIETMETDAEAGSRLMTAFCDKAYDSSQQRRLAGRSVHEFHFPDRGQVALFLFVRGDSRFSEDGRHAARAISLANALAVRAAVTGPTEVPGMKKLFLAWLAAEKQAAVTAEALDLAARLRLKEALPAAVKFVRDATLPAAARASVVNTLVVLGTKDTLKDLAPLLSDKTVLTPPVDIGGEGGRLSLQFRDVALGVSVHLAGEKLQDYGFDPVRMSQQNLPLREPFYFARPTDAARDAAHAKWKAWVTSQEAPAKK